MFRSDSQAYLALPSEDQELRAAINDILAKHEVRAISSEESAKTQTSSDVTQERIRKADFVIADISGFRPSVLLELGMAIGMGKRLLLLSRERSTDRTIDLAAQQVAIYRAGDMASVRKYLDLWLRDLMSDRGAQAV